MKVGPCERRQGTPVTAVIHAQLDNNFVDHLVVLGHPRSARWGATVKRTSTPIVPGAALAARTVRHRSCTEPAATGVRWPVVSLVNRYRGSVPRKGAPYAPR